jgi:hypothetical protein
MPPLRAWSAASLALVGFTVSPAGTRHARADAIHPPVVVEIEKCEDTLAAEVRRIVGVELRTAVVDPADAHGAVTRVVATCRGSEVDLLLADAVTARRLERGVALAESAPAARSRLVALAVAELVVTSWQEIEKSPAPTKHQPPPAPTPLPARTRPTARIGQISSAAEAIGTVRSFPGSDLWLLGAGARGFLTLVRPFRLTLELTAEWGKASRRTGQVAVRAIGGALGLGWGIEGRWAFVMPWTGARAGVARLTGEPGPGLDTSGGTQSGSWLGPELGVAATLFPHAAVHASVALSAGVMLLGVRGEVAGDSNVNLAGPWVALTIGGGLAKP